MTLPPAATSHDDAARARSLLGPWGVWASLDHLDVAEVLTFARSVEDAGLATLWINETFGREPFALLGALARETRRVTLGLGIASIYARDAVTARNGARTITELSGGRFVMGLGVSHRTSVTDQRGHAYRAPREAMEAYLDAWERAPYRATAPDPEAPLVLAALGPRMLQLAARRAAGAFPYFVPPSYVAGARVSLDRSAGGASQVLVVSQAAVIEPDPGRARAVGRAYMERHLTQENYRRNLLRLGYGPDDLEPPGSDRLVDDIVAWGDAAAVAERIRAVAAAGADHVAILPLGAGGRQADTATLLGLAGRLAGDGART